MEKLDLGKFKDGMVHDGTLKQSIDWEMEEEILDWCADRSAPIGALSNRTRKFLHDFWICQGGLNYAENNGILLPYNPFVYDDEEEELNDGR